MGFFQAQWNSGAIVAAWTTFGTFRITNSWAWRIPSLLQALSSVIQIVLCFLVKESPRWLIAQDRDDEAHAIMTKYHANGDPNDPVVELEMEEIREALRIDRENATNTSYLSFFKTKGNRLRFWIILAVGFFSQVKSFPSLLIQKDRSTDKLPVVWQRSDFVLPYVNP